MKGKNKKGHKSNMFDLCPVGYETRCRLIVHTSNVLYARQMYLRSVEFIALMIGRASNIFKVHPIIKNIVNLHTNVNTMNRMHLKYI
jgi:hypothetical protein